MLQPLLFSEFEIYSVLENQKKSLQKAIANAPESLSLKPDAEVVADFVERFSINVPTLIEAGMHVSERELDVDVSGDPMRMFFDRRGPFYIKGTEITVHVPFQGEAELFRIRPSSFSLSPPRGIVTADELLIQFVFPNDQQPPNLKDLIHTRVSEIKQYLEHLKESAILLKEELKSLAAQAWQRRRGQFATRSELITGLGLPIKNAAEFGPAKGFKPSITAFEPTKPQAKAAPISKEWDAFISHASEDKRDIANALAAALQAKGLRIWYDHYVLAVGDSLRQKIDEGLARSRFGIVILSPAFFAKHWPQQELNGLAAREVLGVKVILPIWHNITRDEVATYSPILADRLAVVSSRGIGEVVSELLHAIGNA